MRKDYINSIYEKKNHPDSMLKTVNEIVFQDFLPETYAYAIIPPNRFLYQLSGMFKKNKASDAFSQNPLSLSDGVFFQISFS